MYWKTKHTIRLKNQKDRKFTVLKLASAGEVGSGCSVSTGLDITAAEPGGFQKYGDIPKDSKLYGKKNMKAIENPSFSLENHCINMCTVYIDVFMGKSSTDMLKIAVCNAGKKKNYEMLR